MTDTTSTTTIKREPFVLRAPPRNARMRTVDDRFVRSRLATIFQLAIDVERWPELLPHYRYVRFRERARDDGGVVEMSANRPFGSLNWPTWWVSLWPAPTLRLGRAPHLWREHAPQGARPENVVACRPTGDGRQATDEARCCRDRLRR